MAFDIWLLLSEEENSIIGALLGILLPVLNTTAKFSVPSPELYQYNNPEPTSDLTYDPNTTPYITPLNLSLQGVCIKSI